MEPGAKPNSLQSNSLMATRCCATRHWTRRCDQAAAKRRVTPRSGDQLCSTQNGPRIACRAGSSSPNTSLPRRRRASPSFLFDCGWQQTRVNSVRSTTSPPFKRTVWRVFGIAGTNGFACHSSPVLILENVRRIPSMPKKWTNIIFRNETTGICTCTAVRMLFESAAVQSIGERKSGHEVVLHFANHVMGRHCAQSGITPAQKTVKGSVV
jgi:hypothetical protein